MTLGTVEDAESASLNIVWAGDQFVVGWHAADGYHVRATNGSAISNSLDLPTLPAPANPQLLWTGDGLELYYTLSETIHVDTLAAQGSVGQLSVSSTRQVGFGQVFSAVLTAPGQVTLLTRDAIYSNGMKVAASIHHVGAVGWNGEHLLYSGVLGHGAWTLYGLTPSGMFVSDAMRLQWSGLAGTGRAGGSSFASSASTGRHAVLVTAEGTLSFAVQGFPVFETDSLEPEADSFVVWDGEQYIALLANGLVNDRAANRDISLLAFSSEGKPLGSASTSSTISSDVADERFPVAAVTAPREWGMAWIRGGEVVVQRCALAWR